MYWVQTAETYDIYTHTIYLAQSFLDYLSVYFWNQYFHDDYNSKIDKTTRYHAHGTTEGQSKQGSSYKNSKIPACFLNSRSDRSTIKIPIKRELVWTQPKERIMIKLGDKHSIHQTLGKENWKKKWKTNEKIQTELGFRIFGRLTPSWSEGLRSPRSLLSHSLSLGSERQGLGDRGGRAH